MRLPPIAPADLTAEQRPLYHDMKSGIAGFPKMIETERADGALLGPWNPWLHEPAIGRPIWDLTLAVSAKPVLPASVREIAILAVGARFNAAYEIYAHTTMMAEAGAPAARRSALAAGLKPADLSAEEDLAFDVAHALGRGGPLPTTLYQATVAAFGPRGAAELVYLVGCYALVSITLNAFDVPAPEV